LPVFENQQTLKAFLPARNRSRIQLLPTFKHVLTHKDMHLSPVIAGFFENQKMPPTNGAVSGSWFLSDEWQALGLPAPIRKLLEKEPA
jgi:A/G-specific adenine glycosylase